MAENAGSLQVESISGKRSKIKSAHVLMRFESSLAGFMDQANVEAESLSPDFLWECCGEAEFSFETLAKDYYGDKPTPVQAAAVAISLHAVPIYFYRKGKGHYKAAPEENLKAALAAQERKRLQAERVAEYVAQLVAFQLPEDFRGKLDMLTYEPDKNALDWKALDEAAASCGLPHIKLLEACGAITSAHDYHLGAFLREYFPLGSAFDAHPVLTIPESLPLAKIEAFSIDDSTTTEIDDAFSVQSLGEGQHRIGIHIAAPALGLMPGSALDEIAQRRLSTVYMPGHKITMLPEDALAPFSLTAGATRPALSLYLDINNEFEVVATESRVELVPVQENLRHDTLEPYFNESNWQIPNDHPYWERLALLHRLAEALEKKRGKYDPNRAPQVDYNFYVDAGQVRIVERKRGSPMDKLVAELMIFANAHWGGELAAHDIPGIYRAQNSGKVFMTTQAEPHQGLGVSQYAWSTSPLRRAVDLINQRQMMSLLKNEAAPYPKGSEALTTIMRDFDLTYNAYNEFQQRMERYWCLQWLIQEDIKEINAVVWRENLVRLENVPYMTKVPSLPELPAGQAIKLKIERVDPLLMELGCKFVSRLEAAGEADTK